MKKKILYIITKSNWGGAQKYVHDLATGLPKEQFDVAVAFGHASPEATQAKRGTGSLKERLDVAGIRTISIPRLGRDIQLIDESAVFFSLVKLIRNEKPDVIHLNSPKIGGLGALAG